MTKQKQTKQTTKYMCENCEKELKDNEEIFEVGDRYVCQSCMERANDKAEMLIELQNEDKFIGESE